MKKAHTGTELTHAGRRSKLTLSQGRTGQIVLSGKATFTPEGFLQWLGRATWYVNDLMGNGHASEGLLKDKPGAIYLPPPGPIARHPESDVPDVVA